MRLLFELIIVGALYFIPGFIILRKIGYSGWWLLALFIPFVNMLLPWALALSKWPLEEEVERARNSARADVVLLQRKLERQETASTESAT